MYPANFTAIRQQYMSMPPGPEKVRLGNMMRAMQAELENEYDSASGADPGDATPQMIEIPDPVSGVPTNAIVNAAPKALMPAVVSPAIQYKQPGPGHGRLRPSAKAMAQMKDKGAYPEQTAPVPVSRPPVVPPAPVPTPFSKAPVYQQAPQQEQPQEQKLPQVVQQQEPAPEGEIPSGPEAAPSPGRAQVPGMPGGDQRIADIEGRIANGTATVQDQLMLNMLKGQKNKQQQQNLPPGYGDMGMAQAGLAGLVNQGYKDVEEGAMQFIPSLIQMLNNISGRR